MKTAPKTWKLPAHALWMLLSSLIFASMGVCIKFAAGHFNTAELLFYRGLIGMAFIAAIARARGISLRTRYPAMHAVRSLVGVTSMGAWFYAIAYLPLATAMTLNYMSSIWIAAFLIGGTVLLGKSGKGTPRQGPLALAILASFSGVVMLLRPAIAQNQVLEAMIGLLSGLFAAFSYIQVMAMARLGEPETRTVFYFGAGTALAGGLAMLVVGTSAWDWTYALWLVPFGILASLGQLTMTTAYSISTRQGGTLMVANLQYAGIVFAALYGMALFGDHIPLLGWAGMALIVLSAISATVLRARAAPDAPAEEH